MAPHSRLSRSVALALLFVLVFVTLVLATKPPKPLPKLKLASDKYLRVIAIDGGGVRGILATQILVALEQKIQKRVGPWARINDYIDVIGGTSTGGIMALALLDGLNATAVAQMWVESGTLSLTRLSLATAPSPRPTAPIIFSKSMRNFLGPSVYSAYKPSNLEQRLQNVLGTKLMSSYSAKSYAIVAFDIGNSQAGIFTRDSVNERGDFLAWKVGRATSAAPTYFPTAFISAENGVNYTYVDGGIMANSPAAIVLNVAEHDFPSYRFEQTVLLSIGCGNEDVLVSGYQDWGYTPWFTQGKIVDLMVYAPQIAVDESMARRFGNANIPDQYARIQYDKRSTPVKLPACQSANFAMDNIDEKNLYLLQLCGQQVAQANDAVLERFADYFVFNQMR